MKNHSRLSLFSVGSIAIVIEIGDVIYRKQMGNLTGVTFLIKVYQVFIPLTTRLRLQEIFFKS